MIIFGRGDDDMWEPRGEEKVERGGEYMWTGTGGRGGGGGGFGGGGRGVYVGCTLGNMFCRKVRTNS